MLVSRPPNTHLTPHVAEMKEKAPDASGSSFNVDSIALPIQETLSAVLPVNTQVTILHYYKVDEF